MNKKKIIKVFLQIVSITFGFFATSVAEISQEDFIHLNFNENPEGCFSSVKIAMSNALNLSGFYPDDQREQLISQLALYHSVKPDQILVSNGLSSILFIIADALIHEGTKVITADPTFDFFMTCSEKRGGQIVQVPLKTDYSYDLDAILNQVDADTKVVLICNPNNPTGTLTSREEIDLFLDKLPTHVFVIIDEAYHHFAEGSPGYVSYLKKFSERQNVIVGRTFSKIYGLAGMRVGYIISSKDIIEMLTNYYDPDNNNVAALCGASTALKDNDALGNALNNYATARNEFYKQLTIRGLCYIPSFGNFVMFNLAGCNVKEVSEHFKKNGILIGKSYSAIPGYVRVSLGLPSQMEKFWEVWDNYLDLKNEKANQEE